MSTLQVNTIETNTPSGVLEVRDSNAALTAIRPSAVQGAAAGTPPVFQDSAGTNIGTLCRAWVTCNGSTTILAAFNVSSVTDDGTGAITINFTNPMIDGNYAAVALHRYRSAGAFETIVQAGSPTTSSVSFGVADIVSGAAAEVPRISVAVFR